MNTTQMIETRIKIKESSIAFREQWTKAYCDVVSRFREAIEHLPCCAIDCECPALHLQGWSVNEDESAMGQRFVVLYTPSGNEHLTPVNEIRTAVCKAIGTTLAKRTFDSNKGQSDFVIENQGIEVTLKGATTAPNCEIVPITKTVEITTFEMVCPEGEEPEEIVEALEAKESMTHV